LATVNCNYLVRLLQFNIDNGTVPLLARSLCEPAFACPVFMPIALPLSAFRKAVTRDPSVSIRAERTGRVHRPLLCFHIQAPFTFYLHSHFQSIASYIHRVMRMDVRTTFSRLLKALYVNLAVQYCCSQWFAHK